MNTEKNILAVLVMVFILVTDGVFALPSGEGKIIVEVIDSETNQCIANALVKVYSENGNYEMMTKTDKGGIAKPVGRYGYKLIGVEVTGYEPISEYVKVNVNSPEQKIVYALKKVSNATFSQVGNCIDALSNELGRCVDLGVPENVDAFIEDLFRKNDLSLSDFSSKDLSMDLYSLKREKCGDIETIFLNFRQEYKGIPILNHETIMRFHNGIIKELGIQQLGCSGVLAEPEPTLDPRSKEYQEKKEKGTLIYMCGTYHNFLAALDKPIVSESEAKKIADSIFSEWNKTYFGGLGYTDIMLGYWVIRTGQPPELSWIFGKKVNLANHPRPINANLVISARDGEIIFEDSGFRTITDFGPINLKSNLLFVLIRNVAIFLILVGIVVFFIYKFKKRKEY